MPMSMAEPEDRDNPTASANLRGLSREPPRAQVEANRGVGQSRPQGTSPKPPAPVRDSQGAAERLAVEQELTALRRVLVDKDRTLDGISEECRRLEDAIEDQHRATDRFRQELAHRDAALAAEHQAATELERDRDALRARMLDLGADTRHGDRAKAGSQGRSGMLLPFLGGVGVGLAVAVAIGAGHFGLERFLGSATRPPNAALSPAPVAAVAEGPAATSRRADAAEVPTVEEPEAAPTESDRLPDGTAGPLLALLPAGAFTMGSPDFRGRPDEQPEHQVQVGRFLIGTTEVTFAEYDRFARATGRRLPDDFGWGRGARPVVDVSWTDAQAYVHWLSRQTGRRYRLPSEAEWEYGARGGTRSAYWWGFSPEPGRALCFDCGTSWDGRTTAPVGSFGPNRFGLHDTAGNAIEWTADCYRRTYEGAPADGTAWDWDGCASRVARGGAFNKPAKSMRSAARSDFAPDTRINMLGFRIARDE
jgi:formylglycine-generating enzyme required for sulfatase activity